MEINTSTTVSLCYLLLLISEITSGLPVTSDNKKNSGKSKKTKSSKNSQSQFSLPGLGGMLNPFTRKSTTKDEKNDKKTGKDTTPSFDFDITDMDEFSPNGSIDYDNMALPEPEKIIHDEEENFPLTELNLRDMHERAQYMRTTEIRESILDKLRLLSPPNMTDLKSRKLLKPYPQHLLDLGEEETPQQDDNGEEEDTYHAKIETIVQFAEQLPEDRREEAYPLKDIAYFSIPDTVSKDNIKQCTLLVYVSTPPNQGGQHVQLVVSPTLRINKPLVNRTVTLSSRGHWEHIDVSETFIEWATDMETNSGFVIRAQYNGENIANLEEDPEEAEKLTTTLDEGITTKPHRTPLVKITLNEDRGRYTRSFDEVPPICSIENREKRCCRYKFSINFTALGPDFDFIIAPKNYNANYCAGTCPNYYLPSDGNSKLLMGLVPQKLQRCCSAVKKAPLKIIYVNEKGDYMLGEIPDMVIDKCSCS